MSRNLKSVKKPKMTAEERANQERTETIAGFISAHTILKRVFGEGATAKLSMDLYDLLPDDCETDPEVQDEVVASLESCKNVAREAFGEAAANDPETVLEIYDRLLGIDEDEDEEDDE